MKNINSILKQVLQNVSPSKEEMQTINQYVSNFIKKLEKNIKKNKTKVEIFIGGSFAKNTLIKKNNYDVDIFLRFDKEYKNTTLAGLTSDILKGIDDVSLIHGSRDYFRVKLGEKIYIEIVPVKKVKSSKDAENITDLSYSHVKYINKKVKSKNILDDIKIAKAFCYATQCYGAESYINGFSGYALELLVYNYGSFIKFIKTMEKVKPKLIIDIEKLYKNKKVVMLDLNTAKLNSPVILIDPTYKQRNALAALSDETFKKFQKACEDFLKNPSIESFEIKKTDLEKIKKDSEKKNYEFILLEANTEKQEGDIAGSKLLKFYNHLTKEINELFIIKNKGFNYNKEKTARYFFVVKSKEEVLVEGPNTNDKDNVLKFRSKHDNIFTRKNKVFAREKVKQNLKEFLELWKRKHINRLKEMYITQLKIIN